MTLRAFIIGLVAVAAIALAEPVSFYAQGWGLFSTSSFPAGAVLAIVLLTLVLNVLLKLVRRGWELSQPELMLVWCMLLVGATFPGDGIGRFLYSLVAGGPYMARRADLAWEDEGALTYAPEELVLSKSPYSVAAKQYFDPPGEGTRVPWARWARPLLWWGLFFMLLYVFVFCLMAILRRQWVESERLMFPLARVPLEFTEGASGPGWLPRLFGEKGFQVGLVAALAFRLLRALPLFFDPAGGTLPLSLPMKDIFMDTPLEPMSFDNIGLWPQAVGFAFLVPADVSLSVWFFYWFARVELLVAHLWGATGGGTYGTIMQWQQAGAYVAFALAMLFMARRHLAAVLKKALGLAQLDDSGEPLSYRLAVIGLVLSLAGCLWWYLHHGMNVWAAAGVFAMIICWYLVYARMTAQAGLYVGRTIWRLPNIVNGVTGGRVITGAGAVISSMQDPMLVTGGTVFLSPMAIHSFRIAEVFQKKRRRLLVPILMLVALVAMACTSYATLRQAYQIGGANFSNNWAQMLVPQWRFNAAQTIIKAPYQSADPHFRPMGIGLIGMAFLMFMRMRFYWWPIHPIGLLSCSSWHAQRLWLPFLLGWMTKMGIMKISGGRMLRTARYFFIALILVEAAVGGLSTLVRFLTAGAVPGF